MEFEALLAHLSGRENIRPGNQEVAIPRPSPSRICAKVAGVFLLAVAVFHLLLRGHASLHGLHSHHTEVKALAKENPVVSDHLLPTQRRCSRIENNTEYHTLMPIYRRLELPSAELCCAACQEDDHCSVWNWGAKPGVVGLSDVCFLRAAGHDEEPKCMTRPGIMSGVRRKPTSAPTPAPAPTRSEGGHPASGHKNVSNEFVLKPMHRKSPAILREQTCPGLLDIEGYGPVTLINAMWQAPDERAANVEVLERKWLLQYLKGRTYFGDRCESGTYDHQAYAAFNVLGKTIRYTVDLSGVGCQCAASVFLVPMRMNPMGSQCGDYYCDAGSSCGVPCDQVTIQQANQWAWSSNLHLGSDPAGISTRSHENMTAVHNGTENNPLGAEMRHFGPGALCVDTSRPFEVAASFPADQDGNLLAMEVKLSQSGGNCPILLHLDSYRWRGEDAVQRLSHMLRRGVTPVISYSAAGDMPWMAGAGLTHSSGCTEGGSAKQDCAATVRLYAFSIEDLSHRASPGTRPASSFISSMIERAIDDMREGFGAWSDELARELQNNSTVNASVTKVKTKTKTKTTSHEDASVHNMMPEAESSMNSGSAEWEVIFHRSMNVRRTKNMYAEVLGVKEKGSIVVGRREGEWVRLIHEPGYMRIMQKDVRFMMERRAVYLKIVQGSCADVGLFPIVQDVSICESAAFALGYFDTSIDIYYGPEARPEGCYLLGGYVFFAAHPANRGQGAVGHRQPICSSEPYPDPPSTTTTSTSSTTVTNTSTTETSTTTTSSTNTTTISTVTTTTMTTSTTNTTTDTETTSTATTATTSTFSTSTASTSTISTSTISTTTTLPASSTTTSATQTTETTTLTRGPKPKLYCLTVLGDIENDLPVVKSQLVRHAGIFTCEEHTVFSSGEEILLGLDRHSRPESTVVIPSARSSLWQLGPKKASRQSAQRFLRVWDAVWTDGRYSRCDWTVKVDPDVVFFPSRLSSQLRAYAREGPGVYVLNCEEPAAMLGSLEILDTHAAEVFLQKKEVCMRRLPWDGWTEDVFLSRCLDELGLGRVHGPSLLSDHRCRTASCTDTSKVALSGFKDSNQWVRCWGKSVLR